MKAYHESVTKWYPWPCWIDYVLRMYFTQQSVQSRVDTRTVYKFVMGFAQSYQPRHDCRSVGLRFHSSSYTLAQKFINYRNFWITQVGRCKESEASLNSLLGISGMPSLLLHEDVSGIPSFWIFTNTTDHSWLNHFTQFIMITDVLRY